MSATRYTPDEIRCHAHVAGRRVFFGLHGKAAIVQRILAAVGRPRCRTSDLRECGTQTAWHLVSFALPAYMAFTVRLWFEENAQEDCLIWSVAPVEGDDVEPQ